VDEMLWPTSCNVKAIYWIIPFKMSNLHYNQWEAGQLLEVIINPPLEVSLLDMDKFIRLYLAKIQTKKYEVTIGNFPACICLDFVVTISNLLGQRGKWVPCKHMYYVL
jgi:hypothetical protein